MLSSGSSGNAVYVRSRETGVLIDAGLSARETCRRLGRIGASGHHLDALLVSHEHNDHLSGAVPLCRKFGLPVYINSGTLENAPGLAALDRIEPFTQGLPFNIGDLEVTAFAVPHDSAEPVGFTVSNGQVRLGIATDLGSVTLEVLSGLSECDVVIMESNHDNDMLREGPYPPLLKQRITGPLGHLSNEDAAALLEGIHHKGLKHLVLAHLSRTNNRPSLPIQAVSHALSKIGAPVELSLGWHDRAGEVIRLGS